MWRGAPLRSPGKARISPRRDFSGGRGPPISHRPPGDISPPRQGPRAGGGFDYDMDYYAYFLQSAIGNAGNFADLGIAPWKISACVRRASLVL